MTRNRSSQRTACFGVLPNRWRFASRQLLTSLVFVAALVQVVPAGWASSRLVADLSPDALINESLSVDTHAVEHWATQPTAVARVIDEKPTELEPLNDCAASAIRGLASLGFLQHCQTHCGQVGHLHCLVTLVNLNVRLQV